MPDIKMAALKGKLVAGTSSSAGKAVLMASAAKNRALDRSGAFLSAPEAFRKILPALPAAEEMGRQGLFTRLQRRSPTVRWSSDQAIPQPLWKLGQLNHVAIAVPDLEKATALYRDVLRARVSEVLPLPDHGVYTVFVELGNTKLELLHPLGEKSPIRGFLEKNKAGGIHHICLEVDNIANAIEELKRKNIRVLSDKPQIGAHGKPVVFLHPKDCDGVLIELEQT